MMHQTFVVKEKDQPSIFFLSALLLLLLLMKLCNASGALKKLWHFNIHFFFNLATFTYHGHLNTTGTTATWTLVDTALCYR